MPLPVYGLAENIFVITVAFQNLICLYGGGTYPVKAVIMESIKIEIPVFYTCVKVIFILDVFLHVVLLLVFNCIILVFAAFQSLHAPGCRGCPILSQ